MDTGARVESGGGLTSDSTLHEWRDALVGPSADESNVIHRLRAHPQFHPASICAVRYVLSLGDSDPAIIRIMNDIQRAFFAFFVLYLDARGAITHATIKQLCTELGFTSLGRATAILIHLRMSGFLVQDPIQPDRRSRRYLPSPQTIAAFTRMFGNALKAFALIVPAADSFAARLTDPRIFRAFILDMGNGLYAAIKRGDRNAVSLFDQRNAGLGILFRLAVSGAAEDTYPARGPVPLSINALAGEFKVSRAHVRKLIRDAEAMNLLRRTNSGTMLTLEEPLREALMDYQAAVFLGYLHGMVTALDAVGGEA